MLHCVTNVGCWTWGGKGAEVPPGFLGTYACLPAELTKRLRGRGHVKWAIDVHAHRAAQKACMLAMGQLVHKKLETYV